MKYKRQIECVLDDDTKGKIFNLVTKELTLYDIDYIFIDKGVLNFHKKMFKMIPNWHLMAIVDGGSFKIIQLKGKVFLVYQIEFYRLLVFSILAGVLIAGFVQKVNHGLYVFGFFFFLNIVIAIILHLGFFSELIRKIRNDIR